LLRCYLSFHIYHPTKGTIVKFQNEPIFSWSFSQSTFGAKKEALLPDRAKGLI